MTLRQIASVCLSAALAAAALTAPSPAAADPAITVYIDGRPVNFDVPPTVVDGRVLVPLRGIFEGLGATVDYDGRTQHIVAMRGAQTVELTIGSRQARVNDLAKLLDVPAVAIEGRTMVPLRFVSEALGADVKWLEASRAILIASSGAAGGPPAAAPSAPGQAPAPAPSPATPAPIAPAPVPVPPASPAPSVSTVSGTLVAVAPGATARIVVRTATEDRTLVVSPSTVIFRYNAETNAGGSAALASLRKGDEVTAEVDAHSQATKVTAVYRVPPAGPIAGVNTAGRAVTLKDGRSYVVLPDADITLDGAAADFGALQPGRIVRFSVVAGTNQAYEAQVHVPPASTTAAPAPAAVRPPTIAAPAGGAVVDPAFTVRGKALPGALVMVKAQPKLMGQAAESQTTAGPDGAWSVTINVSGLPFVAFPYVITAVQVVRGTQSDPASVEVSVR